MIHFLLKRKKFDIQSHRYIQKYFKDSMNGDIFRKKDKDKSDYSYFSFIVHHISL